MRFWFALFSFWILIGYVQGQPTPQKPLLTSDWLVFHPQRNQLVPYLPEFHDEHQALYQWVVLDRFTNPRIELAARQGLCLFLDNKLVFTADSTAKYSLNLAKHLRQDKRYLLAVWHPLQQPNYKSFKSATEQVTVVNSSQQTFLQPKLRQPNAHRSALVLFMILVGLLYGSLRLTFPSDFSSIFNLGNFSKQATLEEGLLAKPISNWSSILFVLAFSLSFALLIVTVHSSIEELALLNQLFTATQADIISKILLYTLIIFVFIVVKFLLLRLMGFIFGVEEVVLTQYREFLRTLLAIGGLLPLIMLLYLAFAQSTPGAIYWVANTAITVLLIFTVVRTFLTVSNKYSLQNLHLFSYLCATEVIPLMILLKLIVFV